MKKLLFILLFCGVGFSQTHNFCATDVPSTCAWTNSHTFSKSTFFFAGVSNANRDRDCRIDGLKADGITDDSAALQLCFNNAVASGQGTMILPGGVVELLTGQNFTNKPAMTIKGNGSQRCRFTGSCGTNYVTLANTTVVDCRTGSVACLDFVGSGSTTLENLTLNTCNGGTTCSSGFPTGSSIALLFGRDIAGGGVPYFDYSQWVTLKNVQIQMSHNGLINSTFGSIGIYNYGAEQFSIINSSIYADTPIWTTLTNNTLGIGSSYQTIAAPASNNGLHLSTTDLWYTSGTGAGLVAEGSIGTVQIDNTVGIHTSPIASALTSPAFLFLGSGTNYNWTIKGQMENQNSTGSNGAIINTNHSLDHFNIDLDLAGYVGSGTPAGLIQWNGQTGLSITNSEIRMRNINGTAVPLIQNTANTLKNVTLDLSSTLNPTSLSALSLVGVDIYAQGFGDANITLPGGAFTIHDDTGISMSSGNTTQRVGRIQANQGTVLTTANESLGGNWGTSPSVGSVNGTDTAFTIGANSGTGSPGANPTLTLTFVDGTFTTNNPLCVVARTDTNAPAGGYWAPTGVSLTTVTFTFVGTPAASTSYSLKGICFGK